MIVLTILIAVMLLWLIRALPLKQLNNLLGILLMTGVWSVTWLLLLQFELAVTGSTTGTYGSDATYYYEAMYAGYFSDNPTQAISAYYNQLYIWFGIIILKTSPFFSIIWVKIGNILLLLYVISMIYLMLYQKGAPRQVTNFVCLFSGLNGIVTWMCIRNLKDTLFLFLLVFTCYLAFDFYRKYTSKKPGVNILRFLMLIVLFIIFSHCFQNIRQWAYIIPWLILISLLVRIILNNKFPNKYILILGVGIVLLLSIIYFIIGGDVMNYFRTYASVSGLGDRTGFGLISGLVISLLRFIIGPGPFRAIMGNDVFLVTTNIGNTLIFLGSLMWWLVIPLMVLRIKELIRIIPKEIIIVTPFLAYVFIYIYAYQGSVETRFRTVLYICSMLLWGLTYVYFKPQIARTMNSQLAYLICGFMILVIGTAATYFSLS